MWPGILIAGVLIVWTVGGLASLDLQPKDTTMNANAPLSKMKHWFDEPWEIAFYVVLAISIATIGILYATGRVDWLVIAGGMTALIAGIVGLYAPEGTRIREIAPELVGIAIGVMAIDQLYQIRLEQQERTAIIRQLSSRSNDFALEAVRIIHDQGLLFDGSLKGALIGAGNLKGANFGPESIGEKILGANLEGVDFGFANLEGANFMMANLEGGFLANANFEGANLGEANLADTNLTEANLKGSFLAQANLEGSDLVLCNLEGADLYGANLKSAYLGLCNLRNADLQGTLYNNETVWPDGFDPKSEGAVNWDELNREEQQEWLKVYRP